MKSKKLDKCPKCNEDMYESQDCVILEQTVCIDCCQEACEQAWYESMEDYDLE